MFGFFAGFGWAFCILLFLYVQLTGNEKVSAKEWRNCISVGGVITIFAFSIALIFYPLSSAIQNCFVTYCVMNIISLLVVVSISEKPFFWRD